MREPVSRFGTLAPFAFVFAGAVLLNCTFALAQTAPPVAVVQASNVACKVGRASVKPGETVTWQGQCADGLAQGAGVAQWFTDGKPSLRFEGTFVRGLLDGKGKMIGADGDRYEGDYKGGLRHGHGVYISGSGTRFEGEYVNNQRGAASAAPATSNVPPVSQAMPGNPPPLPPPSPGQGAGQRASSGAVDTASVKVGSEFVTATGAVFRIDRCGRQPRVGSTVMSVITGKLPRGIVLHSSTKSGTYPLNEAAAGIFPMLNEALSMLPRICPPQDVASVGALIFMYSDTLPPPDKKWPDFFAQLGPDVEPTASLFVNKSRDWWVSNRPSDAYIHAQQAKQDQARREAQLAAKAEADKKVADREKGKRDQLALFFKKHSLLEKDSSGLGANPFAFEGERLVLISEFQQMQTATTGLFVMHKEGAIIVSDIPKGTFVKQGKVLLAAKVIGNVKFEGVVGGLLQVKGMVPSVKYLGAIVCLDERCEERQEK